MSESNQKNVDTSDKDKRPTVKMEYHIPPPVYSIGALVVTRRLTPEESKQEIRLIKKELARYFRESCQFDFETRMGFNAQCTVDVECDTPGKRKVTIKVSQLRIPGVHYPTELHTSWLWSAYHDLLAYVRSNKGLAMDEDAKVQTQRVLDRFRMGGSSRQSTPMNSGITVIGPNGPMDFAKACEAFESQMFGKIAKKQKPRNFFQRLVYLFTGK